MHGAKCHILDEEVGRNVTSECTTAPKRGLTYSPGTFCMFMFRWQKVTETTNFEGKKTGKWSVVVRILSHQDTPGMNVPSRHRMYEYVCTYIPYVSSWFSLNPVSLETLEFQRDLMNVCKYPCYTTLSYPATASDYTVRGARRHYQKDAGICENLTYSKNTELNM
jgi:hypothetical protein